MCPPPDDDPGSLAQPGVPSLNALRQALSQTLVRDARRLGRELDRVSRTSDAPQRRQRHERVAAQVGAAHERYLSRVLRVPEPTYPDLPVSDRRDDIIAALREHQVVVIAGETGSGKTTQLPKICLAAGLGRRGLIGHTQPRRIAARAVAERIAEELGTPLGDLVGYQVRFQDTSRTDTLIKVMTDGILLAQIQNDRDLLAYDTIIIDEAHERSLNIDFLLGYLASLLPRRPDLKVIITSATIDVERFAQHFNNAPIIEVSGRTYPVEIRYRPREPDDKGDTDVITAICDAVTELRHEPPGDILVFLSGEREIRDCADAIERMNLTGTEILPLYARLSSSEQHRVFAPHPGRRIVLATNVAETSLTVPGIRYVIDPGTARISRFSMRTKVQRLPIEAISQASANQRAGRCGRVAPGVCIRLYSEEQFLARPEFTEPEILRTNLAAVLLQMAALGLGEMGSFPFIDPPDQRAIRDGIQLLEELHAMTTPRGGHPQITEVGRTLAMLPVDPRLGRMLVEAAKVGALREVLIIVAALAIQDPRERPMDRSQAADTMHSRFTDPTSDFLTLLNLWRHLRAAQKEMSSSAFRRMCQREFLNYLRVREWQDLHAQLRQAIADAGMTINSAEASPQNIHVALLSGLLSHVGLYDAERRDYLGARGTRFAIFPGSALFGAPPRWIMSAELVETSRLWARMNARIDPDWIEPLALHLVTRTYSEPHWERRPAAVIASERVTLYGIPVVVGRPVTYGAIDPVASRDLFIRHALVDGDWDTHHQFFHDNRGLLDQAEDLEHRARRRDIVVDEQVLIDFYDARIPADVVSGAHFDTWWKQARREDPDQLSYTLSLLVAERGAQVTVEQFPDMWPLSDLPLRLTYQFEPGEDDDGVTLHVPRAVLNQVRAEDLQWQVPGLREELVTALIKSLPKSLRVHLVPAPDKARELVARLQPDGGYLTSALERTIAATMGVQIHTDDWDWSRVPEHLSVTIRVMDEDGTTVARGKHLALLREHLRDQMASSSTFSDLEQAGMRSWECDAIPPIVETTIGTLLVRGYPALVDERDSVALRVLDSPDEQLVAMRAGLRKLLLLTVASPVSQLQRSLTQDQILAVATSPYPSTSALLADLVAACVDAHVTTSGPVWERATFDALRNGVRDTLYADAERALANVVRVLRTAAQVDGLLREMTSPTVAALRQDVATQLAGLIYPGFILDAGTARLPHLARYLAAAAHRLTKAPADMTRDRIRSELITRVTEEVMRTLERLPEHARTQAPASELPWMLQELRVNQFAQSLGTPGPISEQRIYRVLDSLT